MILLTVLLIPLTQSIHKALVDKQGAVLLISTNIEFHTDFPNALGCSDARNMHICITSCLHFSRCDLFGGRCYGESDIFDFAATGRVVLGLQMASFQRDPREAFSKMIKRSISVERPFGLDCSLCKDVLASLNCRGWKS